jgi:2-polyprenyl-3-methyl-5-hydroxy-6-metoxy-1,4-benzoquinol methylase
MTATDDYGWTAEEPESSGYINDAILARLRREDARRVLDAGCGNGSLAAMLAAKGYAVTGVDADAGGIELARSRGSAATFATADFARSPADQGLLADGPYDAVISTEVVEHLYSPHELIRFAADALRPGGRLILTTPYHGYLKNLALALTNSWDKHLTANWHGGHIKFWSRASLTHLVEAQGLTVIDFGGVGRLPYLWKSMILTARKP